jgi:hypothetical protein
MNKITLLELRKYTSKHDNYERGRLFEEYIKNLFNQDKFQLKRWRRSFKVPEDTYIGDMSGPDLELMFKGRNSKPFAVECKYKSRFYDNMIGWASENQIKKYVEFQSKQAMTVLIAIGVGGSPSNPKKLFITPLDHISMYTHVFESHLFHFKRNPEHRIDNVEQLKLF